jgi:hypothetical protein
LRVQCEVVALILMRHFRFGWLIALTTWLLSTGCVVFVKPIVKPIDQESLIFKGAVEEETQRLMATGQPRSEAQGRAEKTVLRRFSREALAERTALAQPLLSALRELEKPRGCWAYTLTTKKTINATTTVTVEQFNPFEPEDRLWTLVSTDGRAPDDKAQRDYRKRKIQAWLKGAQRRRSPAATMESDLRHIEISRADSEQTHSPLFSIWSPAVSIHGPMNLKRPPVLEVCTLDTDGHLATKTTHWQGPISISALFTFKITIDDMTTTEEYTRIAPDLPPFLSHHTMQSSDTVMGTRYQMRTEIIYSDYRRVKCYDERFSVQIGPPSYLPD